MSTDIPHLKAHREQTGKTQADIAMIVSDLAGRPVQQSQISRWESDPESIPGRMMRALAQALGVSVDELFEPPRARDDMQVDPGEPYRELAKNVGLLRACLAAAPGVQHLEGVPRPEQVDELCGRINRKPNVVLAGHFDAGKSRLCNALLGDDLLPARYRPTTAANTWLRHVDDRPDELGEVAYIFGPGFDPVRIGDAEHRDEHQVAVGGLEVLTAYGTHQSERSGDFTAVLFLDAPILRACNLIDLPGHQHNEKDAKLAQAALVYADVLVYVSPSTGFLDGEDLVHLRAHIRQLPRLEEKGLNLLGSFFLVASHAHPNISDEQVDEILDDGAKTLVRELGETVFQERFGRPLTTDEVRSRMFPFWFERAERRDALREAITEALATTIPTVWLREADEEVEAFRQKSRGTCDAHIQQYRRALTDLKAASRDLEDRVVAEPQRKAERLAQREGLRRTIRSTGAVALQQFEQVYGGLVSEEAVTRFIQDRYPRDRKAAQKHAAGAVIDLVQSHLSVQAKGQADALVPAVNEFLGAYANGFNDLKRPDGTPAVEIAFDARGTFLGGLASAGTAGALSIWAASLGNLGGYIIVAKVASLLSALGIGVGSGALVSFVAALGGPAVFGAAIAVAVGWMVNALFGEAWERRLARRVVQTLEQNQVRASFQQGIHEYWATTERSFEAAADKLEHEYERQLQQLHRIVHEGASDRDGLERLLQELQRIRDFFGGLPWRAVAPHSNDQPASQAS